MSDPIDELIEWLDKAVKYHETQIETDEEIKESNVFYLHYSGMLSGFQLARTQAQYYRKERVETEDEPATGAPEEISNGWQVLRKKWGQEGACRSCGWHAFLSEHEVEDIDIKEAVESDGILYLECLSKDDEEHRHSHRGIKINLRTSP